MPPSSSAHVIERFIDCSDIIHPFPLAIPYTRHIFHFHSSPLHSRIALHTYHYLFPPFVRNLECQISNRNSRKQKVQSIRKPMWPEKQRRNKIDNILWLIQGNRESTKPWPETAKPSKAEKHGTKDNRPLTLSHIFRIPSPCTAAVISSSVALLSFLSVGSLPTSSALLALLGVPLLLGLISPSVNNGGVVVALKFSFSRSMTGESLPVPVASSSTGAALGLSGDGPREAAVWDWVRWRANCRSLISFSMALICLP
jgi:hypothetical protein